jgi:uncharacterized protein DUF3658
MPPSKADIEKEILRACAPKWLKVARIIGSVLKEYENITENEIGAIIEEMAASSRLESQGNLKRWRFSEVRLPQS